jgi:hypothetical protein
VGTKVSNFQLFSKSNGYFCLKLQLQMKNEPTSDDFHLPLYSAEAKPHKCDSRFCRLIAKNYGYTGQTISRLRECIANIGKLD